MADPITQSQQSEVLTKSILLIVLALSGIIAGDKGCKPGITYLDKVTGNCDPCSDICDLAREQGTLDRCEKLCQGYSTRGNPSCSSGEYYDKTVDRCEPCQSVCLHPRTRDDCQQYCPDWTKPVLSVTATTPDSPNTQNLTISLSSLETHSKENDGKRISTWVYVALIGVGTSLVCGLAILTAILWKPFTQKVKDIAPMIGMCRKRPYQEQGHPMLPQRPIVKNGRGPFGPPTDAMNSV